MSPERWRQVEEFYHAALEMEPDRRGPYLAQAAGGDAELRREVETLLAQSVSRDGPLDRAAWEGTTNLLSGTTGTPEPGAQIGPYRIEALLGEGGMGVVYRALDTKLNRPVAIKFLCDDLDAGARRRFQREARTASSLNHPHILTVHDVGEFEGRQYLITELVDGGSLRDWARAQRRTWHHVVDLLIGVADGLATAHSADILHRDIKPANILVAKTGYAKLADFGLAMLQDSSAAPDGTRSTAKTLTRPGMIVGTIPYMSPEQASGRRVDARSDIFSFGVVTYELLAGRRPFQGVTDLDTLQAVIHRDPEPLGGDVPPALRMAVEKALEKDPAHRYQTMRELVVDLKRAHRLKTAEIPPAVPVRSRARWLRWGIPLVIAAGVAGWLIGTKVRQPAIPQGGVLVQRLTDLVGLEETPAISPDGKTVAFVAESGGRRQIWLRLLAAGAPVPITKDDADHYGPRWSPDSASLIYYTPGPQPGEPGTIWEIGALGGTPQRLLSALGPGDLSHDGSSLTFFRSRDGGVELAVASRDGSQTRTVAKLSAGLHHQPRWSPDDRKIALWYQLLGPGFYDHLMVVEASGGEPRRVAIGRIFIRGFAWMPDGSELIVSTARGSTMSYPPTFNLWAVPVDEGTTSQLTFGESSYEFPDIGTHGKLLVSRVRSQSDVWKFPISGDPADNARRGRRVTQQTGQVQTVSVNPDEKEIAFLSDSGGHANVWAARVSTGEMRPITRESDARVVVGVPVWSPRGDWINFISSRNSKDAEVTLWLVRPDGSNPRDLGIRGVGAFWSADGNWLYYFDHAEGVLRIRKIRMDSAQPVTVREDDSYGIATGADGSTLYYGKVLRQGAGALDYEIRVARPETGPSEPIGRVSGARVPVSGIYGHAFPSPDDKWLAMPLVDGSTTNLWALSTTGGGWRKLTDFRPRNLMIARRIAWSNDGRHIYAAVADVDSDIVMLDGLTW